MKTRNIILVILSIVLVYVFYIKPKMKTSIPASSDSSNFLGTPVQRKAIANKLKGSLKYKRVLANEAFGKMTFDARVDQEVDKILNGTSQFTDIKY